MKVEELVHNMADTIREIKFGATVPVVEEDKGDVVTELEAKIGQTSRCVVVGWDGFKPRIVGATAPRETPFGDVSLVAAVFEKPVVNRRNAAAPRLLEIARAIACALDNAGGEGMDDVLHLDRISPVSGVENGIVTCTVEFSTAGEL